MTSGPIERYLPEVCRVDALRRDARAGLTAAPKWLPPKWLYDAAGSALFDKITSLPEYYPARTERLILAGAAGQIAAASGAHTLAELGSGSSDKTRLLLDALRETGTLRRYVPIDVSQSALAGASQRLRAAYPGLVIQPVLADFTQHPSVPADVPGRRLVAFLGSTNNRAMRW